MKYEDLKILDELRRNGSITEEEYQREKSKLLNDEYQPKLNMTIDNRSYIMLMHLSQFVSFFLIPLIMWLLNNQNKEVDRHGKNILNFIISFSIYTIVASIMIIVVVGIFLLIALGVLYVVFIIIAAMKAYNGEEWKYPMTIEFIK